MTEAKFRTHDLASIATYDPIPIGGPDTSIEHSDTYSTGDWIALDPATGWAISAALFFAAFVLRATRYILEETGDDA